MSSLYQGTHFWIVRVQAQSTIRATPLDLQTMLAMSTIAFVVLTTSLLPAQSVIRAIMLGLVPTLAISTKGSILSTTSVLLMQSTIKAITMGLLPMLSNGLYLVDSISPSNAFNDQGNLAGLAPYDANVDHGPYSVNSMATPSAFHLANNSTKFDPNAANVLDGLLPSNHLNDTGFAYDGSNHGIRDYGFGSQASGLTPAVDNTPSPSITSGSRVDLQGRPRPAGVHHHG